MIADLIETLKTDGRFRPRLAHMEILPAREPLYGTLERALPQSLQDYLDKGKLRLYSHQCEAIEHLRSGKNVVITTPTASGKTLAFNLPVFEALLEDESATALFVYPTKALSNDQLKVVKGMERICGASIRPAIYDGDTPLSRRSAIRLEAVKHRVWRACLMKRMKRSLVSWWVESVPAPSKKGL